MLWAASQVWGTQALRLGTLVVLARFVTPDAFGAYALANVCLGFVQLSLGQGLSAAFVQHAGIEAGHAKAMVVASVVSGLLAAVLLVGASPFLAQLLGQPDMAPVLSTLAVSPLLASLCASFGAMLRKNLEFREIALSATVSEGLSGATSIALAAFGFGVWSLVARQLVSLTFNAALLGCRTSLWRAGQVRWQHYRDLTRVGSAILTGNLIVFARDRLDELVIGWFLGTEALGFYTLSRRQVETVYALGPGIVLNVNWPLLSSLQDRPEAFRSAFLAGLAHVSYAAWLPFALAGGTAAAWVPLLLGQSWANAVPLVQALAVTAAIRAPVHLGLTALIAAGRPTLRNGLELMTTALVLSAMLFARQGGVEAMVWAAALAASLLWPLEIILISRLAGISAAAQFGVLRATLAFSFPLAVGLGAATPFLARVFAPSTTLILALAGGGAAIVTFLLATRPVDLKNFARRLRSSAKGGFLEL